LADRLGVKIDVVRHCIQQRNRYLLRPEIVAMMAGQSNVPRSQRRGSGRPGKLTDTDRVMVLTWHAEHKRSGLERGSMKRLALELGVSEGTLHNCVRRRGLYKKPHREPTSGFVKQSRKWSPPNRSRKLSHRDRETQLRTAAMRTWSRTAWGASGPPKKS
jgi:hypothetical protein